MKTLTIKIPDSVDEKDIKMQLAANLFDRGTLSSGQAAEMVGISKKEFIQSLGQYGISVFGESPEDIDKIINE